MLIVADSSPINILVRIGHIAVLRDLFGTVLVPAEVVAELSDSRAPDAVRSFIAAAPLWLRVHPARIIERIHSLDPGEEAAIALSREVGAEALLIDDPRGRREAIHRGLSVIGTLGVLERAAAAALVDLPETVRRLERTDFRLSPRLLRDALERDARRRAANDPDRAPPDRGTPPPA